MYATQEISSWNYNERSRVFGGYSYYGVGHGRRMNLERLCTLVVQPNWLRSTALRTSQASSCQRETSHLSLLVFCVPEGIARHWLLHAV